MNIIKITYVVKKPIEKYEPKSAFVDYCEKNNVYHDCRVYDSPYIGVSVFLMTDLCPMHAQCSPGDAITYKCKLFTVEDHNEFVPCYDYVYVYAGDMKFDVLPYTVEQAKLFSEVFEMKFPWLI